MSFLPKEVQAGLDAARNESLSKASCLRLLAGGRTYPVLRMWKTGFSVAAADSPHLRGFVDLYDGTVPLFQCLIVAAQEEGAEMQYEFKRATAIAAEPALDFERRENAPVALIDYADNVEG
ncbi:MAG: hypothetical protein AAFY38_06980 [Pseudomonadota bacterium]